MKMWIARTMGDDLQFIFGNIYEQPIYNELEGLWEAWEYDFQFNAYKTYGSWIDPKIFPEVTFENSPMEVELVLPSQEPTIGDLLNQLIETKKEMRKFREMVSRMRQVQKNYSSYESTFGECAKLDLKCREADVDRWLRENEETEFDD